MATSNGKETKQNSFRATDSQLETASDFIVTEGSDGTQGKILGENISLSVIPPVTNFTPVTSNIKGYFQGVDTALGNIPSTTAGIINRIFFTGVQLTLSGGTFFTSSVLGKGAVATASPTPLVNTDNQKQFFDKDIISTAQTQSSISPLGAYSISLSVRNSIDVAQQKYTVEIYKADTNGVAINSGVSGATIGDLGVTLVTTLSSGLINLVADNLTNIILTGELLAPLSLAVGERLRYHVSAEKVGTAGGNITMEVFYGSDHNSYFDIPVTFDSDDILNRSAVLGTTVTDALNTLNTADGQNVKLTGNQTKSGILTLSSDAVINGLTVGRGLGNVSTNTAAGSGALGSNTSGDRNSGFARGALFSNSTGSDNSAFGESSGQYIADGTTFNSVTNQSTFIGSGTKALANSQTNQIVVGYNAIGGGSNSVTLGNTSITKTFLRGNVGIDVSPQLKMDVNGGIRVISASMVAPTTGTGMELSNVSGISSILSYDRTLSAYKSMRFDGLDLAFKYSGNNGVLLKSSGVVQLLNLSGPGSALVQTDALGNLSRATATPLKYIALISQVSTNAPTVTVLENNLSGAIVWTRTVAGNYIGTLSGAFTTGKTIIFQGNGTSNTIVSSVVSSVNAVAVATTQAGVNADGLLTNTALEIRVYP